MFLKNRNFISIINRSKVTDYAALTKVLSVEFDCVTSNFLPSHYLVVVIRSIFEC